MTSIADLKLRFSLRDALLAVGAKRLPDRDGTPIPCPFPERHRHGDANPSFSLYAAGTKAKCFGCGFSGDQFDLIREHFQLPTSAAAVAWVRERFAPVEPMARPKRQPPDLHTGTVAEVEMLSRLRGIGIEALQLASGAGFLAFGRFAGHAAWAVTERSHRLVEWRRLDGKPWPAFGRLTERKSHCQGTGKAKPVGIDDLRDCHVVAWMEGAPDFLAFWQFALAEGKVGHVAPVAMLGAASHRLDPTALPVLSGRHVRFFPHLDAAGQEAVRHWAGQVRDAGATISAFDLTGIERDDGQPGKDLNDLCLISAECWEKPESWKFREVLP